MQKKLFFKGCIVGLLMLLLGVPLVMIESTISERMAYRDEAARSIANDSVGEQHVYGPILVIPYDEAYSVKEKDEVKRYTKRVHHLVFPNQLDIASAMDTERRYRGIHQVLMFNGAHRISGDFVLPPMSDLPHTVSGSDITPYQPFIALAVADVRGVRDIPRLQWGQRSFEFEQGSGLLSARQGLHANLPLDAAVAGSVKFTFDLHLAGMNSQAFVPLAKNNSFTLKSPWPHPQFSGRFLPESRSISDKGSRRCGASLRWPAKPRRSCANVNMRQGRARKTWRRWTRSRLVSSSR